MILCSAGYCPETLVSAGNSLSLIFLNADGLGNPDGHPISEELKAFLDYVRGMPARTDLTRAIDQQVQNAIDSGEGRDLYMTLLEREEQAREEGREEERQHAIDALIINKVDDEVIRKIFPMSAEEIDARREKLRETGKM